MQQSQHIKRNFIFVAALLFIVVASLVIIKLVFIDRNDNANVSKPNTTVCNGYEIHTRSDNATTCVKDLDCSKYSETVVDYRSADGYSGVCFKGNQQPTAN